MTQRFSSYACSVRLTSQCICKCTVYVGPVYAIFYLLQFPTECSSDPAAPFLSLFLSLSLSLSHTLSLSLPVLSSEGAVAIIDVCGLSSKAVGDWTLVAQLPPTLLQVQGIHSFIRSLLSLTPTLSRLAPLIHPSDSLFAHSGDIKIQFS